MSPAKDAPRQRHHPRRTRSLGLLATAKGWQLKRYAMSAGDAEPHEELARAAREAADRDMPAAGPSGGVGWLLLHAARPAYFVTLAWWQDDVDLRQMYYRAEFGWPGDLQVMPRFAVGCVWELDVLVHERAAWIAHVLDGEAPRLDRYLADTLTRP